MAKVVIVYGDGSKAVWNMTNEEVGRVSGFLYSELIHIDNEILDADEPVDLSV